MDGVVLGPRLILFKQLPLWKQIRYVGVRWWEKNKTDINNFTLQTRKMKKGALHWHICLIRQHLIAYVPPVNDCIYKWLHCVVYLVDTWTDRRDSYWLCTNTSWAALLSTGYSRCVFTLKSEQKSFNFNDIECFLATWAAAFEQRATLCKWEVMLGHMIDHLTQQ